MWQVDSNENLFRVGVQPRELGMRSRGYDSVDRVLVRAHDVRGRPDDDVESRQPRNMVFTGNLVDFLQDIQIDV